MAAVAEPVHEEVFGRPAPALAPWVSRYVGYRMEGFDPGFHTGLPGPSMTFIVSLSDPVDIARFPGDRQSPAAMQAFVGGLHTEPARIAHDGNQHGISVDLTPLGARALLGVPAAALAWWTASLDDVLGPSYRSLADRLASCPTWAGRFAVLDWALLAGAASRRPSVPPAEVTEAFRLLQATGGRITVKEIAARVGWSRRHLAERFGREIGLSPKAAARVVRFDRARRMLQAGGHGLAAVAATCGYADQAHFTREFRDLAGSTPTAWLGEELPYVQDPAPVDMGA